RRSSDLAQYGNVLADINTYFQTTNEKALHDNYLIGMIRSSQYAALPYSIGNALKQYTGANEAKRQEMKPNLENAFSSTFEDIHIPLEIDVLARSEEHTSE